MTMNFLKNKLWIFFLIGICKCNTEGHRGSSDSIEDSKRRGTFIGQYRVDFVQDTIRKIINNNIDEVFVEYSWFVKPPQSIIDTTCINIVIRTSDSNVALLTNAYQIKLSSGSNFTQHSKNTLWVLALMRIHLTNRV